MDAKYESTEQWGMRGRIDAIKYSRVPDPPPISSSPVLNLGSSSHHLRQMHSLYLFFYRLSLPSLLDAPFHSL